MLIKWFNRAWEQERKTIEQKLVDRLDKEIAEIKKSTKAPGNSPEYILELDKLRASLLIRKAFSMFESEEIARQRMQLRSSYLAVFMSAVALILSVIGFLLR